MGFLAPIAASLIGSVGSSLLGSKLSNVGPTQPQQQVLNQDAQAQTTALNTGQNLIGMGTSTLQQPLNYWGSILSGNKGLATSALAPEISQIGQGYRQAGQTSAALMPRGGPSAEFNAELPYQQQRDVSTLFQQARPQAATALAGAGQGILGQGANALYASTAAGRDILNPQQQMQQANQLRGGQVGSGLFSLFQQYGQKPFAGILGSLFGGGKGGSTANSSGGGGSGGGGGFSG